MMAAAIIAFAPFDNLSGDPTEDYFARGFVEDVATELSRFAHRGGAAPERRLGVPDARRRRAPRRGRPYRARQRPSCRDRPSGSACSSSRWQTAADVGRPLRRHRRRPARRTGRDRRADRTDAGRAGRPGPAERRAAGAALQSRHLRLLAARARVPAARARSRRTLEARGLFRAGARDRSDVCARLRRPVAVALQRVELPGMGAMGREGASGPRLRRSARSRSTTPTRWCRSCWAASSSTGGGTTKRRTTSSGRWCSIPNDTDVLVHAGLCQAYLGDPEAALASAEQGDAPQSGVPAVVRGAGGPCAVHARARPRVLSRCVAVAPTRMFVDVAAFASASSALTGDLTVPRRYLQEFLADFQERIGFGRARRSRASRCAGCCTSIRSGGRGRRTPGARSRARRSRSRSGRGPCRGRRRGHHGPIPRGDVSPQTAIWTLAFDGFSVQLTHQKGFLRSRAAAGAARHRDALPRAGGPAGRNRRRDAGARRSRPSRAHGTCAGAPAGDRRGRCGAGCRPRRARARGARPDRRPSLRRAWPRRPVARPLGSARRTGPIAVTWRIRNAIKKIASAHPRLGRHLENSVRTGTFCVYEPETPTQLGVLTYPAPFTAIGLLLTS